MVKQGQSPSVGGGVKGLPREGEGMQELPVLAPSMSEQLLDIFNFGADLYLGCERESIT